MIFVKKAFDEITRLHQNSLPNQGSSPDSESEQEESNVEKRDWNGKNLFALGGSTYRERAMNIANWLWSEDERIKYCVEPKKTLVGDREPADEERTNVLREMMVKIMKGDFCEDTYRAVLKHVNQQGVNLCKKRRRSEQKENNPPQIEEPSA